MTEIVVTPLLHGSRAIELGHGMFRKRVLPIGSVEYQGRQLKFSKDYLSGLVDAFKDRAYDFCPIQIADSSNKHTNSPEATRGKITDMTLKDDGLWITCEVGADSEKMLSQYPEMGISARIVENYQRSDGRFFPAALQHALITLDPRVPALGRWEPLEMSNGPQMVVDLSQSSWLGEPGPSYVLSDIADELSPAEQAELDQVMAEAEAEYGPGGHDLDGYGLDELEDFNEKFTRNYAAEAERDQARGYAEIEDLTRPAIRAEDRMARSLSRISQGIFDTSRVSSFANTDRAVELTVATGEGLCGTPDPFGRCSSRYHDLQCIHAIGTDWAASEPPRSTYETALSNFAAGHDTGPSPAAYGDGEDAYPIPARTLELAHRLNESWGLHTASPAPDTDGLFGLPYAGDPYAAMARELGRDDLAGPQPDFQPYPDVSEIARQMGLK
jgi:hypothetical protein